MIAQLISPSGRPYDFVAAGDPRTYADLVTPAGLAEIAGYADGVGLEKSVMIPRTASGNLGEPTSVIADAHAAGLTVHGWTFRLENQFLPVEFRSSGDPAAPGDLVGEIERVPRGRHGRLLQRPARRRGDRGLIEPAPRDGWADARHPPTRSSCPIGARPGSTGYPTRHPARSRL